MIPGVDGALDNKQEVVVQANEKVVSVTPSPSNASAILPTQPEVFSTYGNATALGLNKDSAIFNTLKGYVAGTSITVVWFNQITSRASNASNTGTMDYSSSSTYKSHLQINNMEVKLQGAIDYEYDEEENISAITGECLTYAGFRPKIGDLFIYEISTGVKGVFKIDQTPIRQSIHRESTHRVHFTLEHFLDTENYNAILDTVREVAYFDKKRFLTEDCALLTHQEVVDLAYLEKQKVVLLRHYGNTYYDKDCDSIFRADGLYDPYMVDFLHKTMGMYLNDMYVVQLFNNVEYKDWTRSIFHALLEQDDSEGFILKYHPHKVEYSAHNTTITALLNKYVILLDDAEANDYFAANIMSLDINTLSDFDKLLVIYIKYGAVAFTLLKSVIETVRDADTEDEFYQIPIVVFLMNLLSTSIHDGSQARLIEVDVDPYVSFIITQEMVETTTVSIELLGGNIVGIITDDGTTVYPTSTDITLVDGVTTIDLADIMSEMDITEITGEWKVVTTNPLCE